MRPRGLAGKAGLTLAEAVVTMALVLGVLAGVSGLLREYGQVARFSAQKERDLLAVEMALERMASELTQALSVQVPNSNVLQNELRFTRLRPDLPGRLPDPLPAPAPASWNPASPAHLWNVRYAVAGQRLERDGVGLAEGIQRLETRLANGLVEIRLILPKTTFVTRVMKRAQ